MGSPETPCRKCGLIDPRYICKHTLTPTPPVPAPADEFAWLLETSDQSHRYLVVGKPGQPAHMTSDPYEATRFDSKEEAALYFALKGTGTLAALGIPNDLRPVEHGFAQPAPADALKAWRERQYDEAGRAAPADEKPLSSGLRVAVEHLCDELGRILWLEAPLKWPEIKALRNNVRAMLTAESHAPADDASGAEAMRALSDAARRLRHVAAGDYSPALAGAWAVEAEAALAAAGGEPCDADDAAVERAASAIYHADYFGGDTLPTLDYRKDAPFSAMAETTKAEYRLLARAAIRALPLPGAAPDATRVPAPDRVREAATRLRDAALSMDDRAIVDNVLVPEAEWDALLDALAAPVSPPAASRDAVAEVLFNARHLDNAGVPWSDIVASANVGAIVEVDIARRQADAILSRWSAPPAPRGEAERDSARALLREAVGLAESYESDDQVGCLCIGECYCKAGTLRKLKADAARIDAEAGGGK